MVRQVALGIIIVVGLVGGWLWWQGQQPQSADGIVSGNGRIEADQVDIASKIYRPCARNPCA